MRQIVIARGAALRQSGKTTAILRHPSSHFVLRRIQASYDAPSRGAAPHSGGGRHLTSFELIRPPILLIYFKKLKISMINYFPKLMPNANCNAILLTWLCLANKSQVPDTLT